MKPIKKVRAFIRLGRIQERNTNRKTFAQSIWSAINRNGVTDLERGMILKELNQRHKMQVSEKKGRLEDGFLKAEKAEDFNKLNLI